MRNTAHSWAGWTLAFALPNGETWGPGWSANWSASGQNVTATPLDWNRNIGTGGSTSIGFNGTWNGQGTFPGAPTAFTVNGVACNGGGTPPSPTPSPSTSPSPTTPTISATPASQSVAGGSSATVTLRRNAAPSGNVTVNITRSGSTAVTCPSTATITTANWSTGVNISCTVASGTTAATSTFAAAATGHTSASFSISRSTGGGGGNRVDNPYANSGVYNNPDWRALALSQTGGSRIASQPTGVWLDRIAAIAGTSTARGLAAHLDEAVIQDAANGATPMAIQFVIYNLPGRDCSALASNGELGPTEIGRYQTDYINPIRDIFARPAYANLRIIAIIEIDSIPNLVTNVAGRPTQVPACDVMNQNGNYLTGVGYALHQLASVPNVYNYIDAGHHGWLGWSDNFGATATKLAQAANSAGATPADVHGFITNTANYSALQEPFINLSGTINGQQVRQSSWVDFNNYNDELSFAQAFRTQLISAGFTGGGSGGIGMLIDTSRNGWGNCVVAPCPAMPNRPTAASTSTDLNTNINASRVDRRIHKGNWCNQAGAGLGERPRANPATGIDAYVWIKPPGESDGSSSLIPNPDGKGFDQMCDPAYTGNPRNGNSRSGALPNSPISGAFFPAQFQQLMANAFPPLQ